MFDDLAGAVATPRAAAGPAGAQGPRGRYRLVLMGGFGLALDDDQLGVPFLSQRLVARLALSGRCGRARLADVLWPDTGALQAMANLRTALWRTNQLAPGLLAMSPHAVGLDPGVDVDVDRLVRSARAVLAGPEDDQSPVEALTAQGDLLPDWSDAWLDLDRERLRQLRLHLLETLAERLAQRCMFGGALDAALTALREDPLRETAHRAVIRIHLAEGNLGEARHAFDACVVVLRRELGVGPSELTTALVRGR